MHNTDTVKRRLKSLHKDNKQLRIQLKQVRKQMFAHSYYDVIFIANGYSTGIYKNWGLRLLIKIEAIFSL